MHLFYTPEIKTTDNYFTLSRDESGHCVRVLRLKNGAAIQLIDGNGNWYKAIISSDSANQCVVQIISTEKEKPFNHYLHIAIAPTKNMDRLEWFVEKATEVGISEISLIECSNSERTVVKLERLQKVAIAAMKQSLKASLPKLNEVQKLSVFLKNLKTSNENKLIAHCANSDETKKTLNEIKRQTSTLLLIGPEGDFNSTEISTAMELGFLQTTLGQSRLRTETAALHACSIINFLNE